MRGGKGAWSVGRTAHSSPGAPWSKALSTANGNRVSLPPPKAMALLVHSACVPTWSQCDAVGSPCCDASAACRLQNPLYSLCQPVAPSLEEVVAQTSAKVADTFGANFTIIEAFACAEFLCAGQKAMNSSADAGFMRAVFTHPRSTAPNVAAYVNISAAAGVHVRLEWHDEPFIEDNHTSTFPPASGISFASAFATLGAKAGVQAQPWQVSFRRPLHPCSSEDVFQFSLTEDVVKNGTRARVVSLGSHTAKLCTGFVTQPVELSMCPKPNCWD